MVVMTVISRQRLAQNMKSESNNVQSRCRSPGLQSLLSMSRDGPFSSYTYRGNDFRRIG